MSGSGPLNIPWWVYGLGAMLIALVWVFVWPAERATGELSSLRYFFLRWGHALVWLLLAVSFFLRGFLPDASAAANLIALAALGVYIGFLAALIRR